MKCILCGNNEFEMLFHKRLTRCRSCNLVRTNNFTSPDYRHYHRDTEYSDFEKELKNIFAKRYSIISHIKKKPGVILDVGCSHGVLLDVFKEHGWKTYGIEPSDSAELAAKRGHVVYKSTLEKTRLPKKTFDVVLANHVLEHIDDPVSFLKRINPSLKSGGIVFVDVPNFGSLSSSIAGENWKYLLLREHITHFTPNTLQEVMIASGLVPIHTETRSGIFDCASPLTKLWDELLGFKKNFFTDLFEIPGNCLATALNKGTSLTVVAQKK